MIVVFANKKITANNVSNVLSKSRFKVSAVKGTNGKFVSGCVKIKELYRNGTQVPEDDEDTEYVREKLEDALGVEILEIDENNDIRFK